MKDMKFDYQGVCVDLLDAIGTALYLLEVRQDPASACTVLNEARERSVQTYLSAHGPVCDGTQSLEI